MRCELGSWPTAVFTAVIDGEEGEGEENTTSDGLRQRTFYSRRASSSAVWSSHVLVLL